MNWDFRYHISESEADYFWNAPSLGPRLVDLEPSKLLEYHNIGAFPGDLIRFLYLDLSQAERIMEAIAEEIRSLTETHQAIHEKNAVQNLHKLIELHPFFLITEHEWLSRMLGIVSPKEGDPEAIAFKRVYLEPGSLDFSFSGLKTQALNYLNSEKQAGREISVNDVAASFQEAVVEVIADKAVDAATRYDQKQIVMAGGVASNSRLRALISAKASAKGIGVLKPSPVLCTDNGAMIASAAYYAYKSGERTDYELDAVPGLEF